MSKSNSNSSSVNKCKRCKNVVQTGLTCIVCGITSHKSCLNALKTVKFIDDSTVNCCNDLNEQNVTQILDKGHASKISDLSAGQSTLEEVKIKYLEELIRQKDMIISTQCVAINSLQEQVSFLKRELASQNNSIRDSASAAQTPKTPSYASTVTGNHGEEPTRQVKNNAKMASSNISTGAVSHAIHLAQTSRVCHDVINLNQDGPIISERNTIIRTQNRSRNILIGDAKCIQDKSSLKSAKFVALKHFHTTNWDPETSDEALLSHLRVLVSKVEVEKLNSRNPSLYASFKVSVPAEEAEKITKPEVWPVGVRVSKFFRSTKQSNASSLII